MSTPPSIDKGDPIELDHTRRATGRGFVADLLSKLGPGLVTGASDDDPSGIATYSQVGAQFGYTLLWTMLLSYPLMAAIQEICGRIGRVTGCGLAANLRKSYPKPILVFVLLLMSAANVFNLGADIGAMGSSMALLIPRSATLFTVIFGVFSLADRYFRSVHFLCQIPEVAHPLALRLHRRRLHGSHSMGPGPACHSRSPHAAFA